MNFNLNLQVDKVMNKLSESKILRVWTYKIALAILMGIFIWQLAPILNAIVNLIKTIG